MIVVDVDSTAIATKTGTKGDKPWKMNLQQIAFSGHMVDGFPARLPRESTIQLDDENPRPFPVGRYVIGPESFFFGDFGRFTMGRIKLQPLAEFLAEMQKQLGVTVQPQVAKAA